MNEQENPSTQVEFNPVELAIGSARMTMHIGGRGRPIVLFHSLLADRTSFDLIVDELATTHRVIALNLPGFDGSDPIDGSLEDVADHVAKAIAALQLDDKAIFLGNGYGGFVALLTAIRHPALVERLVLADCGAAFSEPGRAAFRGMSAAAEKAGLDAIADVAMRRLFAPAYQAEHSELIVRRKQRFLAIDVPTFHRACAALAGLDLRPQLASVNVPVLVLVGELDEATPPQMSRELAEGLQDARLIVLPGLAHVPQLQAPTAFMQAIGSFLAAGSEA